MLDIKLIRKEYKKIEEKLKTKDPSCSLEKVLLLDEKIRHLKTQVETLKASKKTYSKKIAEQKQKAAPVEGLTHEVHTLNNEITALDTERKQCESAFLEALSYLPNIPMEEVKVSQDKQENVVLKVAGEKPSFSFSPKNHLELNEKLHLFDFHKTAKTTGSGWPAYRGMGARLEWALINYMLDIQMLNGFELWLPPLLVRPPLMFGSGQLPKFKGQFYPVADEEHELYLIPTAEVVLNGLHYDEIIPEEDLPLKYAAYTPCFRREAGAAGAHERGLIRMHQFNKVEMFCFTHPTKSEEAFEQMVAIAEEILTGLGLHYRLSLLVTGDMSFTAAKTLDIEVWLPGQNAYYEVSSISHCTDYQARRSQIRYKAKTEKPAYVHTLNGSGLATPRLMVALLENNQTADGNILLPPILAEKLGMHQLVPQ